MRNFSSIIACIALLAVPAGIIAQQCQDFFPHEEGTVLGYVSYDKKDRVTGSSEMEFREKEQTGGEVTVVLLSRHMNGDGEVIFENELTLECREGVMYMDASKFLNPESMSAYQSMEVEVDAGDLELPLDGETGTSLDDGRVTAVVRSNGMKMVTMTVEITNRKITGRETITTPAGSFDCVRYTYDLQSEMGFVKVRASGKEWYHPEYGSVRSESFNKKGKLTGYTVLESVK